MIFSISKKCIKRKVISQISLTIFPQIFVTRHLKHISWSDSSWFLTEFGFERCKVSLFSKNLLKIGWWNTSWFCLLRLLRLAMGCVLEPIRPVEIKLIYSKILCKISFPNNVRSVSPFLWESSFVKLDVTVDPYYIIERHCLHAK